MFDESIQENENQAMEVIKSILRKTLINRRGCVGEVLQDLGGYSNLIDFGDKALAITTDGVGSKVLVAQALNKYDTIGIDCVAMNVNDIICVGATPISMVDYIAMENVSNISIARDLACGLAKGAELANIAIVGGETASLPDIIRGVVGSRGFDLAATCIGVVDKKDIITGENIKVGDVVLGISSSGVHSNGLTVARNVMPKNMWCDLLTPSRIYVKEVLSVLNSFDVNGLAHITGGGFLNLTRLTKYGFILDNIPEALPVFRKIQELGGLSDEEMYKVFNMGIGFCLIVSESDAIGILDKYGSAFGISRIGCVVSEPGVIVKLYGVEVKLKRTLYG